MINIIVAHDLNRVIGIDGHMPWLLKKDLAHFKNLTINHTVIMGRKTFLSIGKPLDYRQNIIVSNTLKPNDDYLIASSLKEAINMSTNDEIFIIGGASLYQEALKIADYLYITLINHNYTGDTYFPEYNLDDYLILDKEDIIENNISYQFIKLKRRTTDTFLVK